MSQETAVAQRSGRILECPKCHHPLKVALQEDVEVDTCERCKGVWVDVFEEKAILQMRPEVFTVDELRRLRKSYKPLGRLEKPRYVPCPICKQLMNRRNWGSHSGVCVDKCGDHGSWFDAGELEKVREFIVLGGVEFEKLRVAEQGLSGLESKLTNELCRLDQRVDSAYRRARFWSMLGL